MNEAPEIIMVDPVRGVVLRGRPRFTSVQVVATPGALVLAAEVGADLPAHLLRHLCGDWGDLDVDDRAVNEDALRTGARLLSSFAVAGQERLWIITDAEYQGRRAATTVLKPEE